MRDAAQGDDLVATQAVLYSVSDRYFVQAFGTRFHEALMQGLGKVTPPC